MADRRATSAWLQQRLRVARRRLANRLRGIPDPDRLVKQGLVLGRGVFIADEVTIAPVNPWLVSIGDGTVLAPRVQIFAHDASTRRRIGYTRIGRVRIGVGVFIGASSIVLPGVTIGDGAIVGAGSVVHDDVPARMVAAGNPATVIMSVDNYVSEQRAEVETKPVYGSEWTAKENVSMERRRLMRAALESTTGFVR
jgi:maltose O-acetyltransferase